MAGSASNYFENAIGKAVFQGVTFTPSATLYVALTSDIPTDASTGAACSELPSPAGYARQSLAANATNWGVDTTTNNAFSNNVQISFPQATADWGNISGVVIADSATIGAGNIYFWGSLTTPKSIANTDQLIVASGGISVTIS